ncbi:MAG: hypothetical protein HKL91_07810 [Candidatus Eremiobacteraeota bacterium]|nr:hypothetical protein [Candidatus Eremiobacteraeota bacterium]
MRNQVLFATLAALLLAGCGGGAAGTGSTLPGGSSGGNGGSAPQSAQVQSEDSIASANAVGSPVKALNNVESGVGSPLATVGRGALAVTNGQCNSGVEYFVPDKNGDANSTERIVFYDQACTQIARDTVRKYTVIGTNAESIARSVTQYPQGNTTPSSVRSDNVTLSNATFGSNGFPIVADGFDRIESSTLNLTGVKSIESNAEYSIAAANAGASSYCGDSAGFNATGISSLNETFGWAGGDLSGGTRTVNSDGSVTYSGTQSGTSYVGGIGALNIATGTQNTACPISTPDFTLTGGTSKGSYSIPMTATYKSGLLENLSVTNAQLVDGDTLNVTTNTSQPPTSSNFISGVLTNSSGNQVSTFAVDAFGDGTLTVTQSGTQYVMNNWHVIK